MRVRGWLWLATVSAACLLYQWGVHAIIVHAGSLSTRAALAAVNGVTHAGINLLLLWVFGRTLLRGREPLVTQFARRVHGTIPADIEAYTRRVTAAWCMFFAAQVLLSALLLATASLDAWSLFINVLSFPLVALMFVGEYLYRTVR